MADIKQVSARFAVAPQIDLADLPRLASQGFQHIISNRPDGEAPDQPTAAQVAEAARKAGMTFAHAPFVGQPTLDAVKAVQAASGRTLAFCRSGTRSISAWAMAEASAGEDVGGIIETAGEVGYNLAGMSGMLRRMAAR